MARGENVDITGRCAFSGDGGGAPSTEEEDGEFVDETGNTPDGVDTEDMTVRLSQRNLENLRKRLWDWPHRRRDAIVREVLSLTRKLNHAAYIVRPRRYFVHMLLLLANLQLTGKESRGVGGAWDRLRKEEEAERRQELTPEFMADEGW